MSKKITDFNVGNVVTRVESAKCHYGDDGSYAGDKCEIIRIGDSFCEVKFINGFLRKETHIFTGAWLDGWALLSKSVKHEEEFLASKGVNCEKHKTEQ